MRKLFLLPLFALIVAFAVACGGGGSKDESANSQPGGSGETTSQTLDMTSANAKLEQLRSFRFDMSMKMDLGNMPDLSSGSEEDDFGAALGALFLALFSDMKMEGSVVAPDKADMKVTFAGEEQRFIRIGDKAWLQENGKWRVASPDEIDTTSLFGESPLDFAQEFLPDEVLQGAKTSKEKVNGVDTTRYSFNKQSLEKMAADLGEDLAEFKDLDKADLNVWLNGDGIPVKVSMSIAGKDDSGSKMSMELELNVRDINANIDIKAPI